MTMIYIAQHRVSEQECCCSRLCYAPQGLYYAPQGPLLGSLGVPGDPLGLPVGALALISPSRRPSPGSSLIPIQNVSPGAFPLLAASGPDFPFPAPLSRSVSDTYTKRLSGSISPPGGLRA